MLIFGQENYRITKINGNKEEHEIKISRLILQED